MPVTLTTLWAHYNGMGSLIALLGIIAITVAGKRLVFSVPALAEAKRVNREQDRIKLARAKYPPIVRASQRVGLLCNILFFVAVLPWCVTLARPAWWQVIVDSVVVLLFYDFFYYLMHRFWFHGQGGMRRLHAIHHQARQPSYIDAHYVHPIETMLGLALFFSSIAIMAALIGPFHPLTIVVLYVFYVQINQINHTSLSLPRLPYQLLNTISATHHKHHENMHRGNYASIVMFYDRLFGTREQD